MSQVRRVSLGTPYFPEDALEYPHTICGVFSWFNRRVLFGFVTPFMKSAASRGFEAVTASRLPPLWAQDSMEVWGARLVSVVSRQIAVRNKLAIAPRKRSLSLKTRLTLKYPLLVTLIRVFWKQILLLMAVTILDVYLNVKVISFTKDWLEWHEKREGNSREIWGTALAGFALAAELSIILLRSQLAFWKDRTSLRLEGALNVALYRRLLIPQNLGISDVVMASDHFSLPSPSGGDSISMPDNEQTTLIADLNNDASTTSAGSPDYSPYNVMMLDVPSLAKCFHLLADFMALPVLMLASFTVLRTQVDGLPAKAGLIFLSLTMTSVLALETYNGFLKVPLLRARDERVEDAAEVVGRIKSLRLMGCTERAAANVYKARQQELAVRSKRMYIHGVTFAISDCMRVAVQAVVLGAYVLQGMIGGDGNFVFRASVAIPVMQCVVKLVSPLSNVSYTAHAWIESWVSVKRYEKVIFGASTEKAAAGVVPAFVAPLNNLTPTAVLKCERPCGVLETSLIAARDALICWNTSLAGKFDWTKSTPREIMKQLRHVGAPALYVPELQLTRGECALIVGSAGSGKSSLLMGLLREAPLLSGSVFVKRAERLMEDCQDRCGSVGLMEQEAWLPEGTVKNAILFGRVFEAKRYEAVLNATNLRKDFASWQEGDERLLSQGATNVSGGQRSRISLARALYSYPVTPSEMQSFCFQEKIDQSSQLQGCQTFLLDLPCGSVDPEVGSLMFQAMFGARGGLLRNAASVISVDEKTLPFYLQSFSKETPIGVKFRLFRLDENRILSEEELTEYPSDLSSEGEPETDVVIAGTVPHPAPTTPATSSHKILTVQANEVESLERLRAKNTVTNYTNGIAARTYLWYFRALGFRYVAITTVLIFVGAILSMASDCWIAKWSSDAASQRNQLMGAPPQISSVVNELGSGILSENSILAAIDERGKRIAQAAEYLLRTWYSLYIYIGISAAVVIGTTACALVETTGSIRGATRIHDSLFKHIISAPFWLYDQVSSGALINYLTSDCQIIDISPLFQIARTAEQLWRIAIAVAALCFLARKLLRLLPFVAFAVWYWVYRLYRPASRELQRSRLAAFNPLCTRLAEVAEGAVVLRAFGAVDRFYQQNVNLVEDLMKTQFIIMGTNSWAKLRLQLISYPVTVATYLLPSLSQSLQMPGLNLFDTSGAHAGFVGFSTDLATRVPKLIGDLSFSVAGMERSMASAQRICDLEHMVSRAESKVALSKIQALLGRRPSHNAGVIGTRSLAGGFLRSDVTRADSATPETMSTDAARSKSTAFLRLSELLGRAGPGPNELLLIHSVADMPPRSNGLEVIGLCAAFQTVEKLAYFSKYRGHERTTIRVIDLPNTLNTVTCNAVPGTVVGIVGRTGAGKSTFLLALCSMVHWTGGQVKLDGVDIRQIADSVIPDVIGVLPQFPAVLKGWTVREFLDPQGVHSDAALLKVLSSVGLKSLIIGAPRGLDTPLIQKKATKLSRQTAKAAQNSAVESSFKRVTYEAEAEEKVSLLASADHQTAGDATAATSCPCDNQQQLLTQTQLRLLTLAKLVLKANTLRLVLVDEPPAETADDKKRASSVAMLLKTLFPKAIVIIVAHVAQSLTACDYIWVFGGGQLRGTLNTVCVPTQKDLMQAIARVSSSVREPLREIPEEDSGFFD